MYSQGHPFETETNKDKDQLYKEEIKAKVTSMKSHSLYTTNFSLIEYFVKNEFNPYNKDKLIALLLKDYRSNPKRYVLANGEGTFKSERGFKSSISLSITNVIFIKGPGQNNLSLNLERTVQYLRTIYSRYQNNSSNIFTPCKATSDKGNRRNNFQSLSKITKNQKDKLHNFADNDFLKPMGNKKLINGIQTARKRNKTFDIYNQHSLNSQNHYNRKNSNEEVISISRSISSSNSKIKANPNYTPNPNKNVEQNVNEKNIPEIFHKRLYSDIIISSFNNDNIGKICSSFDKWILSLKSNNMSDQIEDELGITSQSIKELYNIKVKYISLCGEIKEIQHDLSELYNLLNRQINLINIQLDLKIGYSFEVYCEIRNIFYQHEKSYDEKLVKFEKNLTKLFLAEKKLADKWKSIQVHLNELNNRVCNFDFNRFVNTIENELKIKSTSLNYYLNKYINEEYDICSNAKAIVNKFKDAKFAIVNYFEKEIDCFVGNITSY